MRGAGVDSSTRTLPSTLRLVCVYSTFSSTFTLSLLYVLLYVYSTFNLPSTLLYSSTFALSYNTLSTDCHSVILSLSWMTFHLDWIWEFHRSAWFRATAQYAQLDFAQQRNTRSRSWWCRGTLKARVWSLLLNGYSIFYSTFTLGLFYLLPYSTHQPSPYHTTHCPQTATLWFSHAHEWHFI